MCVHVCPQLPSAWALCVMLSTSECWYSQNSMYCIQANLAKQYHLHVYSKCIAPLQLLTAVAKRCSRLLTEAVLLGS